MVRPPGSGCGGAAWTRIGAPHEAAAEPREQAGGGLTTEASDAGEAPAALDLEARTIMTRDVVTCDPDDSIEHVMQVMTRGRFRHLPVVRHGELLGLVSIGDVVKARLEEAQHESEALRAYIVAG